MVARHSGPVFRQNFAGKFLNLAEGNGFKTAGALKAEGEAANSAEQVKDAQLIHITLPALKCRREGPHLSPAMR